MEFGRTGSSARRPLLFQPEWVPGRNGSRIFFIATDLRRTSAAVRCRKRLVQVQVHHVRRPGRPAVTPVSAFMSRRPYRAARPWRAGFHAISGIRCSKIPSVDGLVIISAATSSVPGRAAYPHQSVRAIQTDVFDFVARDHPLLPDSFRARNPESKTFLRGFPCFSRYARISSRRGHFAMRPCCGLQRDGIHAGDFQ